MCAGRRSWPTITTLHHKPGYKRRKETAVDVRVSCDRCVSARSPSWRACPSPLRRRLCSPNMECARPPGLPAYLRAA
jgi:hypothetical protein